MVESCGSQLQVASAGSRHQEKLARCEALFLGESYPGHVMD